MEKFPLKMEFKNKKCMEKNPPTDGIQDKILIQLNLRIKILGENPANDGIQRKNTWRKIILGWNLRIKSS